MSDLLKGNFPTRDKVDTEDDDPISLEQRFEKEALKKLGGSIAFVSKQKVMWDEQDEDDKP